MKGDTLQKFCTKWIMKIEDIIPFVKQEYEKVCLGMSKELILPYEEIIAIDDAMINKRLGITIS